TEQNKRRQLWPDHEILRIVECVAGDVTLQARFAPRPNFAKHIPHLERCGNIGVACRCDEQLLLFQTLLPLSVIRITNTESTAEAVVEFGLEAGEKTQFSVTYAEDAPAVIPPLGDPAITRFNATREYWKNWISQCTYRG